MNIFEVSQEQKQQKGPEYDRMVIFESPEELRILKRAAVARIKYRQQKGLEPFALDTYTRDISEEDMRLIVTPGVPDSYAFLLEEYADRTATEADPVLQKLSERSREIARGISCAAMAFEEARAFDPDLALWGGATGS